MPILLLVLATLVAGDQACREPTVGGDWNPRYYLLADTGSVPRLDDLRHIADVFPGASQAQTDEQAASDSPPAWEADPGPAASTSPAMPRSGHGWTVQIAAFDNRVAAEQGVQRIARDNVVIVPIRRNGEEWFVLLLGTYRSQEAAVSAGSQYAEDSGNRYWVRNIDDLPEPYSH